VTEPVTAVVLADDDAAADDTADDDADAACSVETAGTVEAADDCAAVPEPQAVSVSAIAAAAITDINLAVFFFIIFFPFLFCLHCQIILKTGHILSDSSKKYVKSL
jgi:hypothetical protein